jgi:hypothetical protein
MCAQSEDLPLGESAILLSYTRKHVRIEVSHSLNHLHMAQEKLDRRNNSGIQSERYRLTTVSLTPNWNGCAAKTPDGDANVGQIGLGLTVH